MPFTENDADAEAMAQQLRAIRSALRSDAGARVPPIEPPTAARTAQTQFQEAGWRVKASSAIALSLEVGPGYSGTLRAWRGNLRLEATWFRRRLDGRPVGRWWLHYARVQLRHPQHDAEDLALNYPHRPARDLYLRLRGLADLRKLAAADQEWAEAWVRDHATKSDR